MPNKNYIMSIEQIKTNGYTVLPFVGGLGEASLQNLAKWQSVFALQPHLREKSGTKRGVGFVTANSYRFAWGERALLRELASNLDGYPKRMMMELIEASEELWGSLAPIVLGYAQVLEREAYLSRFVEEIEWGKGSWIIEYRFDPPADSPDTILRQAEASEHGLVAHVVETDAGLQHLGLNARWQDTIAENDCLIVVPGLQLQHRTKGEVRGLCERVVSTEKSAFVGRHSITCTIPLRMSPAFDEIRAGKPLVEHEEGWNYSLPHGELARLFSYKG